MENDRHQQVQVLEYQIRQLQKIIESVDSQLLEINNTIDALKDFDKLNLDTEVLFPLANGIFAKGRITDNKILRINIGSDVNVEKSVNDTIIMMQKQAKEIESYRDEINTQLDKFISKIDELQVRE